MAALGEDVWLVAVGRWAALVAAMAELEGRVGQEAARAVRLAARDCWAALAAAEAGSWAP